jgi:imidazolonepropionase-like amidohydrolase
VCRPGGRIALVSRPRVPGAGAARDLCDQLSQAGFVSPHQALAAASWAARSYLGLPGLVEDGLADAVVYAGDPRADLGQLDTPRAVIVRGKRVR